MANPRGGPVSNDGAGATASPVITRSTENDQTVRTVRAQQTGFYDNARRRPGDVFRCTGPVPEWAELVDNGTPERTTGPQAVIKQQHDETLAAMAGATRGANDAI